jgi:fructokinase
MADVLFGVDVGGTKIEAAALGSDGRLRGQARRANPRGDYEGAVRAVADALGEAAQAAQARIDRVGLGICGNVDARQGSVRFGNAVWMWDRPLRDDLAASLGAPVRMANDADCFALSEAMDGAGAQARGVFGLILGTGVGGGFVADRKLVTGRLGVAGEIGHIPMPRGDADELSRGPCSCGRRGCVETLLSGPSLRADHARSLGLDPDDAPQPAEIARLAEAGDAAAEATLARYQERLGRVLGVLIDLIEPDVVVVGGGLSNVTSLYARAVERAIPHVFGERTETQVVANVHGDSSGVRGAARLWQADRLE